MQARGLWKRYDQNVASALAAALLHGPRVLFLDEPFESVDPVSTRTIRNVLERFAVAGGTVLFSSHVMEVVERVCDRVAVIAHGTVVAEGTVEHLRAGRRLEDVFIDLVGARDVGDSVLARDLRYSWRDPRRKSALPFRTILAVGGPVYLLVQTTDPPPRSVLVAAAVGYLAVLNSMNQFGSDGGALWSDLVTGDRLRVLIVGKNVSSMMQTLPAVAVAAVILAVATGGWVYVPAAVLAAAAAIGVGLGVADVVSARMPFKMAQSRSGFGGGALGAGGGGQGLATALALMVATLVQSLLMAPVVIATAVGLLIGPVSLVVVVPVALASSFVIWRAALGRAVDHGWWREPGLLAAVDPSRSG